jgi:hypothetical protein
MKNLLFLYIICITGIFSFSQNQTISSQKTFGTAFNENNFVAKEYNGFLYLLITPASSGISQDKTVAGFNGDDAWFVKMDYNYNVIDEFVYGGNYLDEGVDFVSCANGDFILLITSNSDISGNKTEAPIGSLDYWVVRINSSGAIVWQKTIGGTNENIPSKILKLNENKFVLFGTSSSPISGNKTEGNFGSTDAWSVFIDGQGNILHQHVYGGSGPEFYGNVSYNLGTNKIVYGVTSGSQISGNKTTDRFGFFDGWAFTTDTNGVLLDQINLGGLANSFNDLRYISFLPNNKILALLNAEEGIGGTKTVLGNGASDAWLVELDFNLNITNQYVYGGTNAESSNGMFLSGNNVILSLASLSGINGNKTEPNYGDFDNWFVCIDPSGNILWQKTAGGNQVEEAIIVGEPSPNNYLVVGNSASGISGNKTVPLYVTGSSDLWLFKLNTTLSVESFESNIQLSASPNPFEEEINFIWDEVQEKVVIEIMDLQGKIVESKVVTNQTSYIWIPENLPAGVYMYHLKTDMGIGSGRIVKR